MAHLILVEVDVHTSLTQILVKQGGDLAHISFSHRAQTWDAAGVLRWQLVLLDVA